MGHVKNNLQYLNYKKEYKKDDEDIWKRHDIWKWQHSFSPWCQLSGKTIYPINATSPLFISLRFFSSSTHLNSLCSSWTCLISFHSIFEKPVFLLCSITDGHHAAPTRRHMQDPCTPPSLPEHEELYLPYHWRRYWHLLLTFRHARGQTDQVGA